MDGATKKTIAVIAAVLVIAAAIVIFIPVSGNNTSGDVEIVDARNRHVMIPGDISRVVCLSAGSVRLMAYFDAVDKIVGIDSKDADILHSDKYACATYRIIHPEIKKIQCIGDETSYREIMSVDPQVIITSKESIDTLNTLQTVTGIPVVAVNAEGNVDLGSKMFEKNIRIIGDVLNRKERADELLNGINVMQNELKEMSVKVTGNHSAYIGGMFYMMNGGFYMTTGNYHPFELVGLENVMEEKMGGNPYLTNITAVSSSNTEYIFIDAMTYEQSHEQFNDDRNKGLNETSAVKNNSVADERIFSLFIWKYYGTNWESELMNAYFIGSVLDPDIFDYDIDDKMDEVLELFYPNTDMTVDDIIRDQSHGTGWLDW